MLGGAVKNWRKGEYVGGLRGCKRGEKRPQRRCWRGKVGLAEVVCQNRAQQGWGKRSRPKHTAQQSEEKDSGLLQAK
jgi:hypothetical protein